MSGIKAVFEKVNTRKMKVFLIFLLCSFLAWTISKLSESYESRTNFQIVYENMPDSLLSKGNVKKSISAKIETNGFQFLNYAISPKIIQLDLKNVLEENGDYFLTGSTVKSQMENQLPNRVSLMELDVPVYYTDLYLVDSKIVPIKPKIDLQLAQNHVLEGKLVVEPDSVQIKGPKKDIAKITSVATVPILLDNVSVDFSEQLSLEPLDSLGTIVMGTREVMIRGKVVKFSEKEFDVAIRARNVPDGYRLKMFPDHIQLLCKAGIERLKKLEASDFEVFVDYGSIVEDKYLFVELTKDPEGVFSVRLLQNRIEFVLEKI